MLFQTHLTVLPKMSRDSSIYKCQKRMKRFENTLYQSVSVKFRPYRDIRYEPVCLIPHVYLQTKFSIIFYTCIVFCVAYILLWIWKVFIPVWASCSFFTHLGLDGWSFLGGLISFYQIGLIGKPLIFSVLLYLDWFSWKDSLLCL